MIALHFVDVEKLLEALNRLVDNENRVLVIRRKRRGSGTH